MSTRSAAFLVLVSAFLSTASFAETVSVENGGDSFVAGDTVLADIDASGDAFVFGQSVTSSGTASGDLHVTGFDVSVRTDVTEDLYAGGATVEVRSVVAGDATAFGFSVKSAPTAQISGNLRMAGNNVTIEGEVAGALTVVGRNVVLNAPVEGDVRIVARTVSFGDNARVGGMLRYSSERRVSVPERVASEDRVQYAKLEISEDWADIRDTWTGREMPVFPTVISLFGAFLISLLFFMVLGALALGFAPKRLERMRAGIVAAPGRSMLLGVIGLSLLFGLVPIAAMTIVGIPFVPFVVLAIILVWTVGYALGAYTVAMHLWSVFGGEEDPAMVVRLVLLALAVTVVALLNFIPFVGWVANFTLVLVGIGAITRLVLGWFVADPDALDVDMKSAID